MTSKSLMLAGPCAAGLLFLQAAPAEAALLRTWVSRTGSNVNPCTATAPCATFQQAYSQTAPGGEIDCADSGQYGPVLIQRALTIDCRNALSSIDSPSDGIDVDGSDTDDVAIMGLTIHAPIGAGISAEHLHSLTVRDTTIAGTKFGVGWAVTAPSALLLVSNTEIRGSGSTLSSYGVQIFPLATNQNVRAIFDHVRISSWPGVGLLFISGSQPGLVLATIADCQFINNSTAISLQGFGPQRILANVVRSEINYNDVGLLALFTAAQLRVRDSTITGNGKGLLPDAGGVIVSYGNNALYGSITADGTFTATLPRQ